MSDFEPGANELRIGAISAAYKKKQVLHDISFFVRGGEIVTLIGPNGAGKSTILKVIAGSIKPSAGSVTLGGIDITVLPVHKRVQSGMAYCIQGGRVFESLTVAENLEMGGLGLSLKLNRENTTAVLELFPNLKELLNQRAGFLSGGERQALAIAVSLIKRPRLLLIDEPSAGLSPLLMKAMIEKIDELNAAWGTTIVLVEQNIREALSIAHRSLVLVGGKVILESSNPKELMEDGRLEQLFLGFKQEPQGENKPHYYPSKELTHSNGW